MNKNVLREKSFRFAVRIVGLCKLLNQKQELILSKQLLRSGTAIGALHREAEYAESKKDFIHKLAIAQKECNETIYWLELLHETQYINSKEFESMNSDAIELLKLLISILKSSKNSLSVI